MVGYETSALSLTKPPLCEEEGEVLLAEYKTIPVQDVPELNAGGLCEWLPSGHPKASAVVAMAAALRRQPWFVIDVALPHSQLATLYPTAGPHSRVPNLAAFEARSSPPPPPACSVTCQGGPSS